MKRILLTAFLAMALCCLLCVGVSAAECTTHTYENAEITTAPSCPNANDTTVGIGKMTYTCSVCGKEDVQDIPATHTYHSEVTLKASCTAGGSITHTCTVCNDSYVETTDPVHAYHLTVVTAATCETDGVGTNKCSLCGATKENVTIPASHTYTNLVEVRVPTCFFEGTIMYDCSVCGKTGLTGSVAQTHENETTVITEATCETEGLIRHTCLYCNATHTDIIEAKHTYDVVNGQPTSIVYTDYTSTGVKYYKCGKCSSTEGVIANPLFIFLGYSASAYVEGEDVEITCGYTADIDAIKEYHEVMGEDKLQYGIVGAYESHVGVGVAPLESETGEPVDNSPEGDTSGKVSAKKIQFNDGNYQYKTLNAKLIGIDYANHPTYFYICLYIYDGTKTVYISDDSCRDVPLPISYSMIVNGDEGHDTVTSSASFGGITYSTVEGTVPSAERLKLIAESSGAYKTAATTADSASNESTVASIGSLGSWAGTVPNANALLNYYLELGGDATHYRDLNVESLITENTVAKNSWQTSINNILRAAEVLAIEGEKVNIDQTTETKNQLTNSNSLWSSNRDWYLTFIDGFYYTDTDLNDLTVTAVAEDGTRTYSATIVYTVIDYYSFYPYIKSEDTSSFLLWGPTKAELAQLHLDGSALDFLIESTITYNVSWTEGQRVAEDSAFDNSTEEVDSNILTKVTE